MRAVRIHEHGGPETLRVDEVPEPVPGPRDLLVRMAATTVNHRDIWIRTGHPHPAYHVELPAILGIDVCGEIVALGDEVRDFRVGDRITANEYIPCGRCSYCRRGRLQYCPNFEIYRGTYAEYALVPDSIALPVASEVPDEYVASFPATYITAWQMLVGKAHLTPGDVVFVWAGTSGLGSAAIDIARLAGATVVSSAGTESKREVLSQRHVDLVVDHYAPDMVEQVLEFTGGEGVTVVFEHVGQATWQRSMELCAQGGTIVFAGATSGDDASMNVTYAFVKQVRLLGSRVGTLDDAHAALRHLNSGRFQPLVGATFALEELPAAHRALEEGQAAGKIVVRIA